MKMSPRRALVALAGLAWVAVVALVMAAGGAEPVTAGLLGAVGLMGLAALALGLDLRARQLRLAEAVERQEGRAAAEPDRRAVARERDRTKRERQREREQMRLLVSKELQGTFRQIEAMQNLYAMLPIEHALPASRGWPASPDLLLMLVDLVDRHRPRLVVECGSGLSTLCFALAMREFGIDGRVVALEHLEEYAAQTAELLRRHGVDDIAEVRVAPLEPYAFGEDETPWYARAAWEDLADVDLFFVDGPPGTLGELARYPALPFFLPRLSPGARIVLDDYRRAKEQAVLERWSTENPGLFEVETVPLEKGAALVTLR